jgi:glycosyltransferase involved in cell wall biosynthesis
MDSLSGGNKRRYEILKRSGMFGVNYIPALDATNYLKAVKFYPDLPKIMVDLRGYTVKIRGRWNRLGYYTNLLKCAVKLALIATKEKVDIITTVHESYDTILITYLASRIAGIPWTIIMQIDPLVPDSTTAFQGSRIDLLMKQFKVSLPAAIYKLFRIRVILQVLSKTETLSVSKSISYELRYFEPRLVIKVLDPALGISDSLSQFDAKPSGCDAFFFTRLIPQKGIFDIPEIWSYVLRELPSAKLAVAGPWDNQNDKSKFDQLCNSLGVSSAIIYLGILPESMLYQYLKSAKLLVYPSLFDSFSFTVLESLACGVPVVAYNTNAMRFIYSGEISVKRVATGDRQEMARAVAEILKNEALRVEMSRAAHGFSSRFTWENVGITESAALNEIIRNWKKKK